MWDVLVCEDFINLCEVLVDYFNDSGVWWVCVVSDG